MLGEGGRAAAARAHRIAAPQREEIAQQIERLTILQRLLDRVARCECIDMEECGRRAASL